MSSFKKIKETSMSNKLMETRKQMLDKLEKIYLKDKRPEDDMFYYHSDEDRIVLSHALFWVMSKPLVHSLSANKNFLLLRMYEEEMLEAYLTESPDFESMLHYCNVLVNLISETIGLMIKEMGKRKEMKRMCAMIVVATGYGGDMDDDLANDLLDDMDFEGGKVKCKAIEGKLPMLHTMVENEVMLIDR